MISAKSEHGRGPYVLPGTFLRVPTRYIPIYIVVHCDIYRIRFLHILHMCNNRNVPGKLSLLRVSRANGSCHARMKFQASSDDRKIDNGARSSRSSLFYTLIIRARIFTERKGKERKRAIIEMTTCGETNGIDHNRSRACDYNLRAPARRCRKGLFEKYRSKTHIIFTFQNL